MEERNETCKYGKKARRKRKKKKARKKEGLYSEIWMYCKLSTTVFDI